VSVRLRVFAAGAHVGHSRYDRRLAGPPSILPWPVNQFREASGTLRIG
jgi:hypothetical protein